jgi:NAD(P)-dependent dehydrogenase (short-subunit alcohol dehydrogenase family)
MARPIAVITGASSGIGRATALAFSEAGYDVVLAARREAELQAAADECRARGAEALVVPTDVSEVEQVEALADQTVARFGGFDVWVNNAGVLSFGRIEDTPPDVLKRVIEVNLGGMMWGARAAIRHFRSRGQGVLINLSSVLGLVGQPYMASYVASKFAARGLSEALRQELHDAPGVHVCAVLPAAIDTGAYQRAANYSGHELHPIWMLYPPDTVARTCVSLARRPRREALAGKAFGLATRTGATLAPGLMEKVTGALARGMEISPRPEPPKDGSVEAPHHDGLDASGGWRRQMAARVGRKAGGAAAVAALSAGAALFMVLRPGLSARGRRRAA